LGFHWLLRNHLSLGFIEDLGFRLCVELLQLAYWISLVEKLLAWAGAVNNTSHFYEYCS